MTLRQRQTNHTITFYQGPFMHNQSADLQALRHSAAHLLAHAIMELYPDTQLTIGPATQTGFFYDVLPTTNFKQEDLPKIAARMQEIVARALPLTHENMPKDDARALYKNNPFKLELIDGIEGETVGIARQGTFFDLCRGGHIAHTGMLGNFKLTGISGSYWRADRDNQPLQRISGIVFFSKEDLQVHEQKMEELLAYDHRKLGQELDLFSFHDEGVGFPFFHPKGKVILNVLMDYVRGLLKKAQYQEIATPMMLSDELWKRSGHYAHYKKNMFFCKMDEEQYAVKPMNCPGSIIIYKSRPRSYRELPMRLAECGLVHRYELSGVLHGLFRVRAFSIDDGHIYCTNEQIEQELITTIGLVQEALRTFGFTEIDIAISTKPENAMGSDDLWETGTQALMAALDKTGSSFTISDGEGAFYGPKIEFGIKDSMGRSWQCGTVQVDFFQPQNFDLEYVTPAGTRAHPVIIHRALYGSFERFFAILLEHYKGKLPFMLAPVQIRVLTITDAQKTYAHTIVKTLDAHNLRVELDDSSDPISGQIKRAQLERIPWMLVLGKKEEEQNTVTLRYADGKQEFGLTVEEIVAKAKEVNLNSL